MLGLQVVSLEAREASELQAAFEAAIRQQADVIFTLDNALLSVHSAELAGLTTKHRLPMMSANRDYAAVGGLMSYGPDYLEQYRRAATYVNKILKGAKPADLPVEQPTKFEFVINLKTAQALGLTLPQSILLQATEVIQ